MALKFIPTGIDYLNTANAAMLDEVAHLGPLVVVNNDTGELMHQVVECNISGGYIIQHPSYLPKDRWLDNWVPEKVEGDFCIMQIADVIKEGEGD